MVHTIQSDVLLQVEVGMSSIVVWFCILGLDVSACFSWYSDLTSMCVMIVSLCSVGFHGVNIWSRTSKCKYDVSVSVCCSYVLFYHQEYCSSLSEYRA